MGTVAIAMRAADIARAERQPLILLGYSNGRLLATRYAPDCKEIPSNPCPDGIILISPAIDVTAFARLAQWHRAVSWLPFFEQFQWDSVTPEIDSYKFTSFPKSPALELFDAAKSVHADLATLGIRFPPVLAFQSLVDDTVSTAAVIDLFRALPQNGSELVLYDVNRYDRVVDLMIVASILIRSSADL